MAITVEKRKDEQTMTIIPLYRPYVFLRCRKCGRKTDHVLINTVVSKKGEIEETYECQECGQTKKIYELASLLEPENMSIQELKERVRAKRAALEQLESRKRELEKRLKESQKKDHTEVTISEAPAVSQPPKKPEEKPKNQQGKKKRRFF
jgi:hypothetical protein